MGDGVRRGKRKREEKERSKGRGKEGGREGRRAASSRAGIPAPAHPSTSWTTLSYLSLFTVSTWGMRVHLPKGDEMKACMCKA